MTWKHPTIFERTCSSCKNDFVCTFHQDGSIETVKCSSSSRSHACMPRYYGPGDAWLKPHWWMLRVVRAAERLTIGELAQDLAGALGAMKEIHESAEWK